MAVKDDWAYKDIFIDLMTDLKILDAEEGLPGEFKWIYNDE